MSKIKLLKVGRKADSMQISNKLKLILALALLGFGHMIMYFNEYDFNWRNFWITIGGGLVILGARTAKRLAEQETKSYLAKKAWDKLMNNNKSKKK